MTAEPGTAAVTLPVAESGKPAWVGLAWVGFRQFRGALTGLAAITTILVAYALPVAWGVRSIAHPTAFLGLMQLIPIVFGVFLGAPLLAREFEAGTLRFAWTQAAGRTRWLATRIAVPACCVAAAGCALGLLTACLLAPYYGSSASWSWLVMTSAIRSNGPWLSGAFDATAITLAGWALFGFSLGTLLGAALRRPAAAMAVTAAVTWSAVIAAFGGLDQLLLEFAPRVAQGSAAVKIAALGTGPGEVMFRNYTWQPAQPWPVHDWVTTADGQQVPVDPHVDGVQLGGAGLPNSLIYRMSRQSWQSANRWLSRHHAVLHVAYQPASRYWLFQGAAGAILLAASVACIAATFWLVHHRPAGLPRPRPAGLAASSLCSRNSWNSHFHPPGL